MGKIRDKMHDQSAEVSNKNTSTSSCAFTKNVVCKTCSGAGFNWTSGPIFAEAELCRCVQTCSICFGSTMLQRDGAAKPCHLPSPKRIVGLINEAHIPARYADATLKAFQNFSGNGRESQNKVQKWYEAFDLKSGPGLILSGPVGVGKTFLLAAITRSLLSRGIEAKFIDFHRLLSVIRAGYSDKKSEESILEPLILCEVLCVDELGKGRNNEWEQEKLDQLIMGRYNLNRPIIATTNYTLKAGAVGPYTGPLDQGALFKNSFNPDVFESLESRVGRRIYSRLIETTVQLEMQGDDFRRKRQPQLWAQNTKPSAKL